ncbi:protein phosphatase 1 regulatory subunit 12C-like [Sycon ciliatum]|uniref:protein phosphatase 1 regulatory subunit 12C-like n=1 Tax=Sycon ciliatum TaxID=27933 RepID=UPI0020ABBE69|eukprot:scpid82752/ scgid18842/ Protein phosphatase 1 regulatory subunit 12C; Protein phosphatase 1 myosin-binding subunit of 85 kDa
MKPESDVQLPVAVQDSEKVAYEESLSSVERRRLFSRRTSEDLIQLQTQVRPATPMTNLSDTALSASERTQQAAASSTRTRSILKSSRQGRSPSPTRRVTFHANVLVWAAAEDGDLKTVKTLLNAEKHNRAKQPNEKPTLDINMSNHENVTLLHLLCFLRDVDAVSLVVELGVDINAIDREGWSALHIAIALNLPELSRLLVQSGADTEFTQDSGALDLARVSDSAHVKPLVEDLKAISAIQSALS